MFGMFSSAYSWVAWVLSLISAKLPTKKTWLVALLAAAATWLALTWDQQSAKLRAMLPPGITFQSPIKLQDRLPEPPKLLPLLTDAVPAERVVVAPAAPSDIELRLNAVEASLAEVQARLGVRRRVPVAK
jgi:hypothetical protein